MTESPRSVPPELANDPWTGANPLDPAYRNDPYPALARLREHDPVNLTPIGFYRLTRYDDCQRLLREVRCGVRTTAGVLPGVDESGLESQGRFMLQQDPPSHTRLRKIVSKAFTPRSIERLRPRIEKVVAECLDRIEGQERFDLIEALALPVPSTLICEMMGVPTSDRERFTVWTAEATHGLAALIAPPEVIATAREAGLQLGLYFQELIERRRAEPREDILTALIQAEDEGDRLDRIELISQCIGLLIAGFETTIGLIGNGVRQLLRHPDQYQRLREQPELIHSAVEECLRFDGPIQLTVRILHEDAEFRGVAIPKDTSIFAMLTAANHDPEQFDEPERFDIARDPNPHLAFGGGAHMCLGAHLARMEARVAIGALVDRYPELALQSEQVEWGRSLFRVPGKLPIRVVRG